MSFKLSKGDLILLLALWLLLFFEPINLGPFKLSQIWKGIIVLLLLFYIARNKAPRFIWIGLLFSFKFLVYIHIPYGFVDAIRLALESLMFPLLLGYFYVQLKKGKLTQERLIQYALLLSIFLIYSAVPFLFGLKSLNPDFDLSSKYGLEMSATKGLFYHVASASKVFTVATIVLFVFKNRFWQNNMSRLFWIASIILGTYLIVMCWTRTGWFIYSGALLIAIFYKATLKTRLVGVIIITVSTLGVVQLYESNDAFKWRLTGGSSYKDGKSLSLEQLASARLPYVVTAIDNMKDEGAIATFFGYGEQKGKDLFEKKTNMSITSHNATFEIIESNGILGLTLYLGFIITLIRILLRNRKYEDPIIQRVITLCLFLLTCFYLTSHGTPIWGEVIYACLFAPLLFSKTRQKEEFIPLNLDT